MGGWNLWKLTAIAMVLVTATAVVTGLVVAYWAGSEPERGPKQAAVSPPPAPPKGPSRQPAAPAPQSRAAVAAKPQPAVSPEPAVNPQPAPRVPTQEAIDACNRYAAEQAGQQDKAMQVAKDAVIGAVAGAAVGAAGGAIAGGGKGAGKGAAIGGVLGAGGGTLYGLNEAKKQDERYRDAYALCMRARGYGG
jgi:hypothetical protein